MIALEQARKHLATLGLKQAVEALDNSLDTAARQAADLPGDAGRSAGGGSDCSEGTLPLHQSTKLAPPALPASTLDQFDFAFQPSIDERQVKELA